MEGTSLQHALRLLHGEPLYAAPEATFIPYVYPPLAYLPMALSAALLPGWLPAARLPSILFTLAGLLLLGRVGARAARNSLGGWIAAGLFAMGFGYSGAFLDLARVDACFVLLVLAGAERLHAGRPRAALLWLALSVLAKQHGLLLLLAASISLLVEGWRRHATAVAAAWLFLGSVYAILELASGGWYGRYTFALPASHRLLWPLFLSFFAVDLLVYLPVLALSAAVDLGRRVRRPTHFDVVVGAAAVASALGRAHPGGDDNVRLPVFALLCVAGAAPLCRSMLAIDESARNRFLACAALALQMVMLWQPPGLHHPRTGSARAFAELRGALQRCAGGGRAVALDYALLTGEPFLHTMALSDLRMGDDVELAPAGTNALLSALRSQRAPAALAVGERFPALQQVLAERYHECARMPSPRPATGYWPGLLVGNARMQIVYSRNAIEAVRAPSPHRDGFAPALSTL
jgi:hypothetical protein